MISGRKKTRQELMRISMAVTGIEFSYAAETAFVSPTLLKIGVEHQHMTLVWALSPLIGFFLTPVFGSLSDRCPLKFGRRRPFIVLLSIGVLLGLILVPNGEKLGLAMGDTPSWQNLSGASQSAHRTSATKHDYPINSTQTYSNTEYSVGNHPWGIFFTVLGTILLDFDADACQSPARAYLLDVTIPDDHARGLSTFTIMAGLGGTMGYAMGGFNWDATFIGMLLGGHVKAVFTLITIIFIICVTCTVTSFKEMPLEMLQMPIGELQKDIQKEEQTNILGKPEVSYGTLVDEAENKEMGVKDVEEADRSKLQRAASLPPPPPDATLLMYLKSIVFMPSSLLKLCLTNLFCWMAHVCYSLYFTDFVGEAVFHGIPTAPEDSVERMRYEEGVRFGCWGMAMYSLSCACYSTIIEKMIHKFGAKRVYITGLLIYSVGMFLMAVTKNKIGVILFSWTAGVMYSTLFTMPFLLVAHYHAKGVFETNPDGEEKVIGQVRGLGTDLAIVSSMVFLAQFILSLSMGTIVSLSKTTTAVVSVASFLAFCGAISAKSVLYLDL
ncbi:proton-associated sugar transporter A isoform X2 [Coccinella septempunctata]|uniref:proton-associated sugar transporter A isoform X2 n=1 Tax=Coccinella septempunctata TaxID=41139 RepID=UPI001D06180E|nr:proton-associated sugar transporter A isoform X2 [Coccinella septempunctata]